MITRMWTHIIICIPLGNFVVELPYSYIWMMGVNGRLVS